MTTMSSSKTSAAYTPSAYAMHKLFILRDLHDLRNITWSPALNLLAGLPISLEKRLDMISEMNGVATVQQPSSCHAQRRYQCLISLGDIDLVILSLRFLSNPLIIEDIVGFR